MSIASDRLALYLQAEASILSGQEVRSASGRSLKMPDLEAVRSEIRKLQAEVAAEAAAARGQVGPGVIYADLSGGSRRGGCC